MAGMDIMRDQLCARRAPKAWRAMVDNLRRAEREVGRSCGSRPILGTQTAYRSLRQRDACSKSGPNEITWPGAIAGPGLSIDAVRRARSRPGRFR